MHFAVIQTNAGFFLCRVDFHGVATVETEYPIEAEAAARKQCEAMNKRLEDMATVIAKQEKMPVAPAPGRAGRRYFEPDAFA